VDATAPLDGLTVLEVSSFVAAPLGGLTLAQLNPVSVDSGPTANLLDWAARREQRANLPPMPRISER
jgi:hypothetical protein